MNLAASGGHTGTAVLAALGAAACFGLATALQHAEAGQVARRSAFHPQLIASLAVRRGWLLSFLAEGAAIALQGLALANGRVSLVSSLIVFGLPIAVVLSVVLGARRLRRRDVTGLVLCTVGLIVCAVGQPPGTGRGAIPPVGRSLLGVGICAVLVAGLLALARRPHLAGAATGAAAGIAVGVSVPLLALVVKRLGDIDALLATWPPYALIAVGLAGLTLSQAAFQTGALGAPLATLTLTEPLTAVALAVGVLHQRLPRGLPAQLATGVGAAVAAVGVVLLAWAVSREEPAPPEAAACPAGTP